MFDGLYPEYVSVAERQRRAQREVAKLRRQGRRVEPISVEGRQVASTVWGKAWCTNLEAYSDFASRLPRGRAYLRHGQVVDLEVLPGKVRALVSGTELYRVEVKVKPLPAARWRKLVQACAGQVASVVELLQGRLSAPVMEVLCHPGEGLFPTPKEIALSCTCPDFATLCKHVAASLYGVGARLDTAPQLLFTLRQVDGAQLVTGAAAGLAKQLPTSVPTLSTGSDLEKLFAIELAQAAEDAPAPRPARPRGTGKPRQPKRRKASPGRRTKARQSGTKGEGSPVMKAMLEKLERLSRRFAGRATGRRV
ncbi:MAG TPA: SWIM zinc finger family protein [Myxococcaceae bacterium]|jgi:uncharacterized Zn finger protein